MKSKHEDVMRLGTFGRSEDTELRASLREHQSHDYIDVRIWKRDGNHWYPTRTGCSVRHREAGDLGAILLRFSEGEVSPEIRLEPAQKPRKAKRERKAAGTIQRGWGTHEARQAALANAGVTPPWAGESAFT